MPASNQQKTLEAVRLQIRAMGSEAFEVGLFNPNAPPGEPVMLPRVWDRESLLRSVAWLRHENRGGRNIYIRPRGEHNLSLVDDLQASALQKMKNAGFTPAVVVETSPGNFQAWMKHPEQLTRELATTIARVLAEKFGGDIGAADWRHYGRLAGFTNRKNKYRDPATQLHPFVRVLEASGSVYPQAPEFLSQVRAKLAEQHRADERRKAELALSSRNGSALKGRLKSIDDFRTDSRYAGDGTRIDLAFAMYALSHGATTEQVETAIRSRDLSHKGTEKRQAEYVERTIKKALAGINRDIGR